jgi:hypothetical protein
LLLLCERLVLAFFVRRHLLELLFRRCRQKIGVVLTGLELSRGRGLVVAIS